MTRFRLFCCLYLLLSCSTFVFAEAQHPSMTQLQQENSTLQRKVRRLEAQVEAMREELNSPDSTQVIGGIGYIVGIFGVAGWIAARKKSGQGN